MIFHVRIGGTAGAHCELWLDNGTGSKGTVKSGASLGGNEAISADNRKENASIMPGASQGVYEKFVWKAQSITIDDEISTYSYLRNMALESDDH